MGLNALRKFSHNSLARFFVRSLGLSSLAQRFYYWVTHKGRTTTFREYGETSVFVCNDVDDLRSLEQWVLEPALKRILQMVDEKDIALDIGANRGVYSMFLAKKVRQVIALEPEKRAVIQFQQNVLLNHLQNCTVIAKALGSTTAHAVLHVKNGIGTIGPQNLTGHKDVQSVEIVRGDDLINSLDLPAPSVIKIDVEGYEGAVLRGLERTLRKTRVVLCEIHPQQLAASDTVDSILRQLHQAGLKIVHQESRHPEIHVFAAREPLRYAESFAEVSNSRSVPIC